MDLHLTSDTPNAAEQLAVDSVLDAPESGFISDAHFISGEAYAPAAGHAARANRHLLLPVLHAIQERIGWISPGALNYACQRLTVPPTEAYGVATFYALFSVQPKPPVVAHVCDDIACMANGAETLCAEMAERFGAPGSAEQDSNLTWHHSPCLGMCERPPAAMVTAAGVTPSTTALAPVGIDEIAQTLADRGHTNKASEASTSVRSVPQAGSEELRLLRRVDRIDPDDLASYCGAGGYRALERALDMGPAQVVREVVASKLLGRGGAAFPAGVKWQAVASAETQPRYMICNADESEPGTFKDRVVMEEDPFAVVEAMTIAGAATGCGKGYIYLRGEYPLALERMTNAIAQARGAGLLGSSVLGHEVPFDIEIRRGAGAYICGEETALFNSIEGFRGEPRNKPPFPTEVGLFGKPTLVNNVETLINVLDIALEGGDAFAAIGTEQSTGTKLFCLSGHVARPGVYEVPFGTTLEELISLAGGVAGNGRLQAVLLGGAAGTFLTPQELALPLTFEATRTVGATLGSGVVMLFDDSVNMQNVLLRIAAFFRDESCGQCVPCRVGTVRQEELLHRLVADKTIGSVANEIHLLNEVGQAMRDASICGLGQTASSAIESAVARMELFNGKSH
ncbi:MAG: NAD(P)H-dependent oxidoreductase subunit E [Chloroflexota bacterium]|nr:NAD(P)H-dependent oxidoreductase subunit E [Chloroflexota bacterium]